MQTDNLNNIEPDDNKEQKVERVISELETIDYPGVDDDTFDYSNDRGVGELIPQITQLSQQIPAEIRAALIVGGGPLWNIPKTLSNIDLTISFDINKKQLERNISRMQEILSAEHTQDLFPVPNQNIVDEDKVAQAQEKKRLQAPHIEIDSYGDYHYLYSEEELLATKEYLRKAKFAYVCGDISDKDFTTQLGNILKKNKVKIVFADLSNISEWVCGSSPDSIKRDTLINSLNLIPIDRKCPILHSVDIGQVGRSHLHSKLSIGLKSYGKNLMYK